MIEGSAPKLLAASLIAQRSTMSGAPVKSCRRIRDGLNGISVDWVDVCFQLRICSTLSWVMLKPSQFLKAHSKSTLIEMGSFLTLGSLRSCRL